MYDKLSLTYFWQENQPTDVTAITVRKTGQLLYNNRDLLDF